MCFLIEIVIAAALLAMAWQKSFKEWISGRQILLARLARQASLPTLASYAILLEIIIAVLLIALAWEKSLEERVGEIPWLGEKIAPVAKAPAHASFPANSDANCFRLLDVGSEP